MSRLSSGPRCFSSAVGLFYHPNKWLCGASAGYFCGIFKKFTMVIPVLRRYSCARSARRVSFWGALVLFWGDGLSQLTADSRSHPLNQQGLRTGILIFWSDQIEASYFMQSMLISLIKQNAEKSLSVIKALLRCHRYVTFLHQTTTPTVTDSFS